MAFESDIENSVAYLASPQALRTLEADPYWPKWDSPWWHMLLLYEMGATHRIPAVTVRKHVEAVNAMPVKIFPIQPGDVPAGLDPTRHTACHCQLANIYRVLESCGVDVDVELPWIRPWFIRYQMPDGGLNCDASAYLVEHECPSSMVGTISAFEALLLHTNQSWTNDEIAFLNRAAHFLIERQLMLASATTHNAAERAAMPNWMKPCFPRFYFYDVLRGLDALVHWSDLLGHRLPQDSIQTVVNHLERRYPDDVIHIGRSAIEDGTTVYQRHTGQWVHAREPASTFGLLRAVSIVGDASPFLSLQWQSAKERLQRLTTA